MINELPPYHFKFQLTNTKDQNSNINTSILYVQESEYFPQEQFVIIRELLDIRSEDEKNRFEREIEVLRASNHFHFNKILYFEKTYKFVILEFLCNGDLFEYIVQNQDITKENLLRIIFQLIRAISILHEQNVIHRDIKPENILLDKNYNIVLADFQFSRPFSKRYSIVVGTEKYQAPELKKNNFQYSEKVDIYALGVTLFFLYFPSELINIRELTEKDSNIFSCFNNLNLSEIDQDIINLIKICTSYKPEDRYSINEINSVFNEYLTRIGYNIDDFLPKENFENINGSYEQILETNSSLSILCNALFSYYINNNITGLINSFLELITFSIEFSNLLNNFILIEKKKNNNLISDEELQSLRNQLPNIDNEEPPMKNTIIKT